MSETRTTEQEAASAVSAEVERLIREDMLPLADLLEETFARAAKTIEQELAAAAKSGAVSFRAMTEEILNDLARLAAEEFIRQPIESALLRALGAGTGGGGGNSLAPGSAAAGPSQTAIADLLSDLLSRAGRNS